jgi:hypothetical protein
MFTTSFTLERHIEELRAELRATIDIDEASEIRAELEALLVIIRERQREEVAA